MKQVIAIFDSGVLPDVMQVLEQLEIARWTRLSGASGAGERNVREGNAIWPGLNEVLLIVLPPERVQPLIDACHAMRDSFPLRPGMRFIVSDCEIH
ncbi:MAG: hypothetical protein FJX74_15315 [Armatimonadetes bacterium]|nr:hypothetical protein [Armatimonadota bacterium]